MSEKNTKNKTSRRNFLKGSLAAGASAAAGAGILSAFADNKEDDSGEKVKLLSQEGELVEVDKSQIKPACEHDNSYAARKEARKGIPNRKFVMVIDLARCKNARKCVDACEKMHHTSPDHEYIKVLKMQDSEYASPYWMPKPCFHCDNPPCVKVCPTQATFQRSDGIVLVDNEICMGCRYCMIACPYSARVFNWKEPEGSDKNQSYSPETGNPRKRGTVEKCDFCPDMIKQGKLPLCITACPMGVFYFGDVNEDTVTNGDETVRFSDLLRDKAGYRYKEGLGTNPSVYYLPPVNRPFPFKDADENKEV